MSFLDRFKRSDPDGGSPKKAADPAPADAPKPKVLPAPSRPAPDLQGSAKKGPETPAPAAPAPDEKHEILLDLGDFLPRIPKQKLHDGPHDTASKLKFDIAEQIGRAHV